MTNINVRIVGTATVTGMTAPFERLKAEVAAVNMQLERMVSLQNGVDAKGYQTMTRAAAQNSSTMRNAAASTGMFEVQQLKLNKATDDYITKLQKQKVTLAEAWRGWRDQNSIARKAYQEQLRLEQLTARASNVGVTHGKTLVDVYNPSTISDKLSTATKKFQYFNEHLRSGATSMVNWGKNTQWAGRQLTVGFAVPLAAVGAAAGVMAYQTDQALTRVQKVYNTTAQHGIAQQKELDKVREDGMKTAIFAAKQYGSAGTDTLNVQAELAAAGQKGVALQKSTAEVMRISRLGELDYADAIKSTISLQTVFNQNTTELTKSFNYMNAIENATSLQTEDFAKAIPIAAAPVKAFGGDIQELGILLTAMKSRGVEATQGANAIKAAMQRLGRPSEKVQEEWTALTHTDITKIFNESSSLLDMFQRIGKATDDLGRKDKIRAFAGLFGTYQVTRMMALVNGMKDLNDATTQTGQAYKIAQSSSESWSKTAQTEIERYQNSISGKWDRAIQEMKLQLSTLGKPFVEVATGMISKISDIIKEFNKLPRGAKVATAALLGLGAAAGVFAMFVGLTANLVGNFIKFFSWIGRVAGRMEVMTTAQKAAALVAEQTSSAYVKEADAVELLQLHLDKLRLSAELANRETQQNLVNSMVASGVPEAEANRRVQSAVTPFVSAGANVEKASSKAAFNWKGIAASAGLATAAMVTMAISTNSTVDKMAEMVMYAAMLGPMLIPLGKKMAAGFVAARAEMAATEGAFASMRAGGAAFAGSMGVATLATAGILVGVTAIAGGLLLYKHHQDEIAAKQKAILDAQLRANAALSDSTASIATNMGKAAGYYRQLTPGAPTGGGNGRQSQLMERFNYYNTGEGKAEPQAFIDQGSTTGDLLDSITVMDKAQQKFLDLQVIGKDTAKQAKTDLEAILLAAGTGSIQASQIANEVYRKYGDINKLDWTKPLKDQQKAMEDIINTNPLIDTHTDTNVSKAGSITTQTFEVNTATQAYITAQGKKAAAVFGEALASAQGDPGKERKVIKQYMDMALREWDNGFKNLASQQGQGFDQINQVFAKFGVTSGKSFAENWEKNTDFKSALQGILQDPANRAAADAFNKNVLAGQTWEKTLIGPMAQSSSILAHNIWTVVDALNGFTQAYVGMTKAQAVGQGKSFAQSVERAQRMLEIQKALNTPTDVGGLFKVPGGNQAGEDQARAALNTAKAEAKASINAILLARGLAQGKTYAQALYNLMHGITPQMEKTADGAKNVKDNLNKIPTRISITLDAKESVQVVHDAMSAVQDDMVTSAQNNFNATWDAKMTATQNMWDARSSALQRRQAAASQALQNRQQDASDALDRRFQKRQDEINKSYQDRIDAVKREIDAETAADDKRQKMYEREKARIQALADMANSNIDFNAALNEGNFDEAAKIRNDQAAKSAADELDREEAAASARTQRRIDALNKRSDSLEKQRDKELKALAKLEDAQKKALDRMQQHQSTALDRMQQAQQDALKRRSDADMAAQQKTRDYEEAMLDQRLDLFKSYIAKNQKDLTNWMHKVGLKYDDFGTDIKAKGESWASYFQKSLLDHIRLAGTQVKSDNMWSGIGKSVANKLIQGIGFKSLGAFQKFINTGIMKDLQRGGGRHSTGGSDPTIPGHRHTGGLVDSSAGSRGNIPANYRGMHPSEVMIRAQKGEFVLSKETYAKNKDAVDAMHQGTDVSGKPGRGSIGNFTGIPVGMYGAMLKAGTMTSIKEHAKGAKAAMKSTRSDSVSGGFKPGPGGHHRPINGPVTNGLHDEWTGYPAYDFAGPVGRPVYAVMDGTITRSYDIPGPLPTDHYRGDGPYGSYGRVIYMHTAAGPSVLYAHLSKRSVAAGQNVKGGSVLGYSGNTGNSSGPHLHFGATNGPSAWLRAGGELRWDNTSVTAHKGETVLTAPLTKAFKDNVASGGGNSYSVTVNIPEGRLDLDENKIADLAVAKLKRMEERRPRTGRRG